MKAKPRIFLSYARQDAKQVDAFYKKLAKAKFTPWMDKKDILAGQKWLPRIQQAIKRSDFFVICLSRNSVEKRGVLQEEIRTALEIWRQKLVSDVYFIPVRLEDCQVPEDLGEFEWVDLFEKDGWMRLVNAIQAQMKVEASAPLKTTKKRPRKVHQIPVEGKPSAQERISSLRTQQIIGRQKEIRAIQRAIAERGSRRVLMFVGLGGIGKTRLLEEVGQIIENWKRKQIRWSGVIDVYHPEAHSDLGIRDQIIAGLDPTNRYFKEYRSRTKKYREHLAEGFGGKALEGERVQLEKVFMEGYKKLAADYRIVLVFDTLELVEYEADVVQELCQIETETTTLKNWLLTEIPRLPNTVTILGGRPQKQRLSADSTVEYQDAKIWVEFEAGFEKEGIFRRREDRYELNEFTTEEAEAYYGDLAKRNSRLSSEIPESELKLIWAQTERRPIRLSLVIDLALHGPLGAISPLYAAQPGEKPNIDEQLIEMLLSLENPSREVLLYLAAARKGLNADLMHYLEPDVSKEDWARRLEDMKGFTFVKSRPNTDLIFLHDELYELFERKSELSDRATGRHYYNRIAEYYRRRLAELDGKLRELRDKGFEERESYWRERQEVMLSLLHYELQIDPKEGFERVFARWDDEAVEGHEIDFDNRLRDELWRFLGSPVAQLPMVKEKIDLNEINRDSAVRWVWRYIAREDFVKARRVAENILQRQHPLFQPKDSLFLGDLNCAYGEALWYLDAPGNETVATLDRAITLLDNATPETNHDPWRRNRILGRAYNDLGNYWQQAGRSEKTLQAYRHAIHCQT